VNTLPPDPAPVPTTPPTASERVIAAFERITAAGRPELWSTLRAVEDVLVDAKAVDERVKAGEDLPLAGTVLAVPDLIDVAGQPSGRSAPWCSARPAPPRWPRPGTGRRPAAVVRRSPSRWASSTWR
jgi:hypothetical protein